MAVSQPALLGWLTRQMPRMHSKAYRWVAEMEEIAAFVGEAFDTVHHDGIRAALEDFAARWLTTHGRKG